MLRATARSRRSADPCTRRSRRPSGGLADDAPIRRLLRRAVAGALLVGDSSSTAPTTVDASRRARAGGRGDERRKRTLGVDGAAPDDSRPRCARDFAGDGVDVPQQHDVDRAVAYLADGIPSSRRCAKTALPPSGRRATRPLPFGARERSDLDEAAEGAGLVRSASRERFCRRGEDAADLVLRYHERRQEQHDGSGGPKRTSTASSCSARSASRRSP